MVQAQARPRPDLAESLAYGRIALGLALMLAPGAAAFGYMGRDAARPSVRFVNRLFGGRDVALGAWLLMSRGNKDAMRQAMAAGIACDAWDAVSALTTKGALPKLGRPLVAMTATGAAIMGAVALSELDR